MGAEQLVKLAHRGWLKLFLHGFLFFRLSSCLKGGKVELNSALAGMVNMIPKVQYQININKGAYLSENHIQASVHATVTMLSWTLTVIMLLAFSQQ